MTAFYSINLLHYIITSLWWCSKGFQTLFCFKVWLLWLRIKVKNWSSSFKSVEIKVKISPTSASLEAIDTVGFGCLSTEWQADIWSLIASRLVQFWLVKLVLCQDYLLYVLEYVRSLTFYLLQVFSKRFSAHLVLFHKALPLLFLLSRWWGKVNTIYIVVAFCLRNGFINLCFCYRISVTKNFCNVKVFTAKLYSFELTDKVQKLDLILEIDSCKFFLDTLDDSESN